MKQEEIDRIKNWCFENNTMGLINNGDLNEFLDNFNNDELLEKTKTLVESGTQKTL